jgi:hypothetical protein
MSTRTDALLSQQETGKITASIESPLRPVATRRTVVNGKAETPFQSTFFRCSVI